MATRPKIKKDLPKKLPPVEPDKTKEEMTVTGEKLGKEITEGFIPENKTEEAFSKIKTGPEDFPSVGQDKGKPDPGTGETDTKGAAAKETIIKNMKPGTYVKNELPTTAEQPFLFGEADQILNTLETELAEWKMIHERIDAGLEKLVKKIEAADERIESLELAINATRKHAPMKEDPGPPEQVKKSEIPDGTYTPATLATEVDKQMATEKVKSSISHITEIPKDQPMPETTIIEVDISKKDGYTKAAENMINKKLTEKKLKSDEETERTPDEKTTSSSTSPAPDAPTSSAKPTKKKEKAPVKAGAAERTKDDEDNRIIKFRNGSQPVPEVLFPGDIVDVSWTGGPYRVESIAGPFHAASVGEEEIASPPHYSLQCSEVDAKRNKDGRLPKSYEYSWINLVVAVGNRFLSVFEESQDEIFLVGQATKQKSAEQQKLPATEQAEDIY